MKIFEVTEPQSPVQEAIQRHIDESVPFTECMFRPGSDAFYEFYTTVKTMYREGRLPNIDWQDQELLGTDIGESIIVEGERVPLDVPMEDATPDTVKFTVDSEKAYEQLMQRLGDVIDFDGDYLVVDDRHWGKAQEIAHEAGGEAVEAFGEASPMIVPPSNEFSDKKSAFAYAKEHGGKVKQRKFTNPRTGDETVTYFVEGITEAEYQGRDVELNKPKRGGPKKFYVYVRDPKTKNVKKVSWGDKGLSVKAKNPGAVRSFVARHKCKQKKDKTKAGYWACRTPRYKSLGVKGGQWW